MKKIPVSKLVLPRPTAVRIRKLSAATGQSPDEIVTDALTNELPKIKRKPLECWVSYYPASTGDPFGAAWPSLREAQEGTPESLKIIHMREVL